MYYIIDLMRQQVIPMKNDNVKTVIAHAKNLHIKYVILKIEALDVEEVTFMNDISLTNPQ